MATSLESIRDILVCPVSRQPFTSIEGTTAYCATSETTYSAAEDGIPDFRLQQSVDVSTTHQIGAPLAHLEDLTFEPLSMRQEVEVDYSSIQVPFHFTKELLSHIPKANQTGARVLDLGCGNGLHQPLCEQAGYEYVGIDYGDPGAPMFADAHRLPFADESFDFVMSMAVLEHLQFPFVAMQEVRRVLKPGGVFLGTVAFLEPFHGNSYFHHTHMGTLNSLVQGGLEVEFVCPSTEWGVLEAQAAMGLFPRVPSWISKLILLPVKLLHRLWFQLGRLAGRNASEHERIRTTTGSFYFRAHKP